MSIYLLQLVTISPDETALMQLNLL